MLKKVLLVLGVSFVLSGCNDSENEHMEEVKDLNIIDRGTPASAGGIQKDISVKKYKLLKRRLLSEHTELLILGNNNNYTPQDIRSGVEVSVIKAVYDEAVAHPQTKKIVVKYFDEAFGEESLMGEFIVDVDNLVDKSESDVQADIIGTFEKYEIDVQWENMTK